MLDPIFSTIFLLIFLGFFARTIISLIIPIFDNFIATFDIKSYIEESRRKTKEQNFSNLEELLVKKQWLMADVKTSQIICGMVPSSPVIDLLDLLVLPLDFLIEIDELWSQHSDGQFGFTAQKEVYDEVCDRYFQDRVIDDNDRKGTRDLLTFDQYIENHGLSSKLKPNFIQFGQAVGWCAEEKWLKYNGFKLNNPMPKGHLPAGQWLPVGGDVNKAKLCSLHNRSVVFAALMYRLEGTVQIDKDAA